MRNGKCFPALLAVQTHKRAVVVLKVASADPMTAMNIATDVTQLIGETVPAQALRALGLGMPDGALTAVMFVLGRRRRQDAHGVPEPRHGGRRCQDRGQAGNHGAMLLRQGPVGQRPVARAGQFGRAWAGTGD